MGSYNRQTNVRQTHSYRYNGEPRPCISIREHTETHCAPMNAEMLLKLCYLFRFSLRPSASVDTLSKCSLFISPIQAPEPFTETPSSTSHPKKKKKKEEEEKRKEMEETNKVTRWSIRILIIRRIGYRKIIASRLARRHTPRVGEAPPRFAFYRERALFLMQPIYRARRYHRRKPRKASGH